MRRFIDRIHEAKEYDYAWATASLPLKVIVLAVSFFETLLQGFIVIAMTITLPLWIVPYVVIWNRRNKK